MQPTRGLVREHLLAQRLRELRETEWPDVELTQSKLGDALGVSIATISTWESTSSPRIPPYGRVLAYARFFATRRSIEDGTTRVLDEAELTAEERARRDELSQELLSLRAAATGAGQPGPTGLRVVGAAAEGIGGLWHFADGKPVTMVCSELPLSLRQPLPYADPSSPDYVELYAYAELDALIELHGHIRAANPSSLVHFRVPSQMQPDDYTTHLVLLGGVDWNGATREVLSRLGLPVRQVSADDREHNGFFEVTTGGQPARYRPVIEETASGPVLREDVAHFYRGPNPFNVKRTVTICNTMFGRGTLGAVRALTDVRFRDRNEAYIASRFPGRDEFSILVRVPVLNGGTMTPDWTLPDVRLHEWPEAEE